MQNNNNLQSLLNQILASLQTIKFIPTSAPNPLSVPVNSSDSKIQELLTQLVELLQLLQSALDESESEPVPDTKPDTKNDIKNDTKIC